MKLVLRSSLLLTTSIIFLIGCGGIGSTGGGTTHDTGNATLQTSINHIIFMAQENRGFDHYFGMLNQYRAAHGLPQDVDGLPANAANISWDGSTMIPAFHMITMCTENLTPSWLESHHDYNLHAPTSDVFKGDGFAAMAGGFSAHNGGADTLGMRAMGYYTDQDLPYYYFMTSTFATSDRFFAPAPVRTQANRLYLLAATSHGHAYAPTTALSDKTIFELLEDNHISWKVYVTNNNSPTSAGDTYMNYFTFTPQHLANFVPLTQYFTDVQNGTLPQVALIESGYESGEDEHPLNNMQTGVAFAAKIINALMNSSSWKDSAFILTYDEGGGFYDHVQPMTTVNPDGIPPQDLTTGDPPGDFTRTGFRLPMIVVSPFAKKGYVSHIPADNTAILKFIETRFNLPPLNKRDAMQMDMTDFFDFNHPSWPTPPAPPAQPTNGPCYYDHLP